MSKNEIIFYSVNEKFRLGADSIQREERYSDGRVSQPSKVITFFGGVHITSDPKEIKVIRDCHEFGLKRVREINQEELQFLNKVKAELLTKTVAPMPTPSNLSEPIADEGTLENAPI